MKKILFLFTMLVLLFTPAALRAQSTLLVHDGTTTNSYVPVYGFYADAYLKAEFVYPAAEVAVMAGGNIESMTFYLSSPATEAWTGTFQVFLKEVSSSTISEFSGTTGATVVYEGTLDATSNTMTVSFTTPYSYNGGNLLVGFYETTTGNYKSASFYGETVTDASVQGYSYTDLASIAASQRNFLPKTEFTYEAGSSNPTNIAIGSGTTTNSYLPSYSLYNYTLSQQIYTAAEIGGPVTINTISFYNGGTEKTRDYTMYLLHTSKTSFDNTTDWVPVSSGDQVFTGSVTMVAGDWTTFTLNTPFEYNGTDNLLLVMDDNTGDWSSGLSCYVFDATNMAIRVYSDGTDYDPYNPTSYDGTIMSVKNQIIINQGSTDPDPGTGGVTEVTIGDGTGTTYVTPYNSLWGYSFVEQIYTASEIGQAGNITSISFNLRETDAAQTNQIDVFMKNVSRSEFTSNTDYEQVAASDMVFSGTVTFNPGWTTITLDSPFEYDGTSNLMIGIHEYTSGYSTRYFYYTPVNNSVVTFHSDGSNPDPYNLGSYSGNSYVSPNRSNIQLTFAGPAVPAELTVFDGTSTNGYVPVYGFYADAYLKAEVVYPASDLADIAGGTITGMTFYASNSNVSWGSANFQVFLKEVSSTSISDFSGAGTQVYEGALSIVGGQMTVNFTTPYTYNGGNLLLGVYNTVEGTYTSCSWYGETVSGASVQGYSYSDLSSVSPTQRNFIPKTTFLMQTPVVCNTPPTDVEASNNGRVSWTENGSASTWEICVNGDEANPIEVTENPYTLTGLTDMTVYTVKVRSVCDASHTTDWSDEVGFVYHPSTGGEDVTIGDGTGTTYYGPYNSLWGYSFVEQLYPASEIGQAGTITAISFNMSSSDAQTNQVDVFMKNVSRSEFTGGEDWEAVTASDMVFSGTVTFNSGWTTITLDSPFEYDGTSNLMIGMHEYTPGYSTRYFYYTSATGSLISGHSDSNNPNPYDMASFSGTKYVQNYRPNIKIQMTSPVTEFETTVADGTATNSYVPVYGLYVDDYQKSEIVYPSDLLTDLNGNILTGMTFYASNTNVTWPGAQFQVFLKEVSNTTVSSFDGPGTVVYEGPLSIVNGQMVIDFNLPYQYNGGNLLVGVYEPTTGTWSSCSWYGQTVSGASVQGYTSSSLSAVSPSQRNFLPKVTFSSLSECSWAPSGLAVVSGSVNAHGATVTWNGNASSYIVMYGTGDDVNNNNNSSDPNAVTVLSEGFEGGVMPTGWTTSGSNQWTVDVSDYYDYAYIPHNGNYMAISDEPGYYTDGYLVTPAMDLSSYTSATLSCWYINEDWAGDVDEFGVYYRVNGGSWNQLFYTSTDHYDWTSLNIPLVGLAANYQIGFYANDGYGYGVGLDDILITATPAASSSEDPQADNNGWITDTVTTTTYTMTGLNPETEYKFKVKADCGNGQSDWATVVFTTAECQYPLDLAVSNVQPTTAVLSWNDNGESAWQLCINGDEDNLIEVTENPFTITGLDRETIYTVKLRGNCGDFGFSSWSDEVSFQFGYVGDFTDGENEYLPTYTLYNYSLTEQIYSASEIGNAGFITSISFYNNETTVAPSRDIDVYLAHTTKTAFENSTDWVSLAATDLVYSGTVTFTSDDWTEITFDTPFEYNGTDNLLVVVDDNTGSYVDAMVCRVFAADDQAIQIHSDYTDYDPSAPTSYYGTVLSVKNQIKFHVQQMLEVTDSVCDGSWYAQHGFLLSSDSINNAGPDFVNMVIDEQGYDSYTTLHITSRACPCGVDITDIDGNVYETFGIEASGVKLCWIKSNLRTTRYADATEINPEPIVYSYPYNPEDLTNLDTYGRLYDYATVTNGETGDSIQGVCPTGWIVPTQEDFNVLINNFSLSNLRSETNWLSGNGNNASGFNMQPGGYYSAASAACERLHGCACFYTANFTPGQGALHLYSYCGCDDIVFEYGNVQNAYSVRCVKRFQ